MIIIITNVHWVPTLYLILFVFFNYFNSLMLTSVVLGTGFFGHFIGKDTKAQRG